MDKRKIAVLFGGCSPEYSVSLQSAHAVITHMDRDRYEPVLIGISPAGDWFHYTGAVEKIPVDAWMDPADCAPVAVSPSRSDRALIVLDPFGVKKLPIDGAFPVLHGKNGEDGTVQGLFELAGIPVIGCGVLASALCMDKDRAHRLVRAAGVAVPEAVVLRRGDDLSGVPALAERLGLPLFVKPVRAGSSYGVTRVTEASAVAEAVELAFTYDDQVIVEEGIPGFEVGCAVLGNRVLSVGEPDEIELSQGFFDFTEKYTLKTSAIHVPARVSPEQLAAIKEAAQVIYRALDCRGFARVDLFLTPEGKLVFNEVNTIPGFTSHSRYPKMMECTGLSFSALVDRAIELGLEA